MKLVFIYGVPGVGKLRNLTSTISGRATLDVDNSALTAEAVARRIAHHFSLPRLGGELREGTRS